MIKIAADSSCDRPLIAGLDVVYPPLTMSTDERSFVDDEQLDALEMMNYMSSYKGRSYTACPSVDAWLSAYEGGDEIFAFTITSGLSGSYNSAMAAADLYVQSHPGVKIHVFDSLSTGPEVRLLLEKLAVLLAQDLPFEQVVREVVDYQKHTRLFFVLQSLHNLSQNGRVSKVAAAAVGVLNIRIVGTASKEGTLEQLSKSRGDNKALKELFSQIEKAGYAGGSICITHADNLLLAERFAAMVKDKWPNADLKIAPSSGLCSYYAEHGSIMIGVETNQVY